MRIVLFDSNLFEAGGEERLMLEHARYLRSMGHEVWIWTVFFDPKALFDKYFDFPVITFSPHSEPRRLSLAEKGRLVLAVRRKLRTLRPDLVVGQLVADCGILYIATLYPRIRYVTHIHGTIMWFPGENTKYSFLHRKNMRDLIGVVTGHRQFYLGRRKATTLSARIKRELDAVIHYLGVRKAEKVFTLSNLMAREIHHLYGKPAIVLRGAYESRIFEHTIRSSIKEDLQLEANRVILNINRLDPRKRVDLLIKAFALVQKNVEDTYLVIGGEGQEQARLRALAQDLGLERVIFLGFVPEEKLLDYYATCDLFVHPNWADYAITAYEALAMGKKLLCTEEMEFEEELLEYSQIFTAEPLPDRFAQALVAALETPNKNPIPEDLLRKYTWDNYFKRIEEHLISPSHKRYRIRTSGMTTRRA